MRPTHTSTLVTHAQSTHATRTVSARGSRARRVGAPCSEGRRRARVSYQSRSGSPAATQGAPPCGAHRTAGPSSRACKLSDPDRCHDASVGVAAVATGVLAMGGGVPQADPGLRHRARRVVHGALRLCPQYAAFAASLRCRCGCPPLALTLREAAAALNSVFKPGVGYNGTNPGASCVDMGCDGQPIDLVVCPYPGVCARAATVKQVLQAQ